MENHVYTQREIHEQLALMGIFPGDTVLMHSSLKALMPVEGGADGLLDAMQSYLTPKGLLVLPTHTWDRVNDKQPWFDYPDMPCCVGTLPEIFRKRPGVVRSLHPTHSVAAWGQDARDFCQGNEKFDTPCARQSPYGRLMDRNGFILLAGCPLTCNTFIHGVEEWENVPGRLTPGVQALKIRMPDGSVIDVPSHRHMGGPSGQYDRLLRPMGDAGALYRAALGHADCFVMRARRAYEITAQLLKENPAYFSKGEGNA
nr:AAC(3) family N-acetyltransferase [bacterium]